MPIENPWRPWPPPDDVFDYIEATGGDLGSTEVRPYRCYLTDGTNP